MTTTKATIRFDDFQRLVRVVSHPDEPVHRRIQALKTLRSLLEEPSNHDFFMNLGEKLQSDLKYLLNDRVLSVRQESSLLLGRLCALYKTDYSHFFRWFFQTLNNARPERMVILLNTLREFLVHADKAHLQTFVPMMTINIRTHLEEIQNPELLIPLLEILHFVSDNFPDIFRSQFQDVIDLLVGWRLDTSLPEHVANAISDCFVKFHRFWVEFMNFSINLFNNLVSDMYRLADKAPVKPGTPLNLPRELLCYLGCTLGIMKGIGREITLTAEGSYVVTRLLACLKTIHEKFGDYAWLLPANKAILSIAEILGEKYASFQTKSLDFLLAQLVHPPPTNYLKEILKIHIRILCLESTYLILPAVQRLLSEEVLKLRLHPQPQITELCLAIFRGILKGSQPQDAVQLTVETFIQELEKVFESLEKKLTQSSQTTVTSSSTLPSTKTPLPTTLPIQRDITTQSLESTDEAKLFSFDISVLGAISQHHAAHLERIFQLILQKYHPITSPVISQIPSVQLATIKALFELCMTQNIHPHTHQNIRQLIISALQIKGNLKLKLFILTWLQESYEVLAKERSNLSFSSSDDIENSKRPSSLPSLPSLTSLSSHSSLPSLPSHPSLSSLSSQSSVFSLSSLSSMTSSSSITTTTQAHYLDSQAPSFFISLDLFWVLLQLAFDHEAQLRSKVAELLQQLARQHFFDEFRTLVVALVSLFKLDDVQYSVREPFMKVLSFLDPAILLNYNHLNLRNDPILKTQFGYLLTWRKTLSDELREGSELFRLQNFQKFMNFVTNKEHDLIPEQVVLMFLDVWTHEHSYQIQSETLQLSPAELIKDDKSVKEPDPKGLSTELVSISQTSTAIPFVKTYSTCEPGEKTHFMNFIKSFGNVSLSISLFWALWESARFCVNSRLKTHFGGPVQTFENIERIAIQLAGLNEVALKDAQTFVFNKGSIDDDSKVRGFRLLTGRTFLEFVDNLEKQIYNAYEGSINLTPISSQSSQIFFYGNRKVCMDWFSRMRPPLFLSSVTVGFFADIIRHGFERLHYWSKFLHTAFVSNPSLIKDPKKIKREVESVLSHVVTALYRNRDVDALEGLFKWCKKHFPYKKSGSEIVIPYDTSSASQSQSSTEKKEDTAGSTSLTASAKSGQLQPSPQKQILSQTQQQRQHHHHQDRRGHGGKFTKQVYGNIQIMQSPKPPQQQQLSTSSSSTSGTPSPLSPKSQPFYIDLSWFRSLITQCKGCYENAVESLKSTMAQYLQNVLQPDSLEYPEKFTFLLDNIIECYLNLSDWEQTRDWLTTLRSQIDEMKTLKELFEKSENKRYLEALMEFDRGDLPTCNAKIQQYWHEFGGVASADWPNPYIRLRKSEELLLNILSQDPLAKFTSSNVSKFLESPKASDSSLSEPKEEEKPEDVEVKVDREWLRNTLARLQICRGLIEVPLQVMGADGMQQVYPFIIQLQCISTLENGLRKLSSAFSGEISTLRGQYLHPLLHDVGPWNKMLRIMKYTTRLEDFQTITQLAKLARLQDNLRLTEKLLKSITPSSKYSQMSVSFETCKLLYSQKNLTEAILKLWNIVSIIRRESLSSPANFLKESPDELHLQGKVLLKLAKWLYCDKEQLDFLTLRTQIQKQEEFSPSTLESLIGNCYRDATIVDPIHPETWFKYADWCYYQGHKTMKHILYNGPTLTTTESTQLNEIVALCAENDATRQATFLNEINSKLLSRVAEGTSEVDDSQIDVSTHNITTKDDVAKLFLTIVPHALPSVVDQMVDLWSKIRCRILNNYKIAIESYCVFLRVNNSKERTRQTSEVESLSKSTSTINIIATLRLLRLLVKYGREFVSTFHTGFKDTPTAAWRDITPQLFARLNHPEDAVRQQVILLLSKIGEDYPHVVAYPAIVGVLSETAHSNSDISYTSPSEKPPRIAYFQRIVDNLAQHNPQLINELQLTMREFTRITILWEEKCATVLKEVHSDVHRRAKTMKEEVTRIQENAILSQAEKARLISEKYATIMKPSFVKLERLIRDVSLPPQTPQEKWFQETFGKALVDALQKFKNPDTPEDPLQAYQPFKDIFKALVPYTKPSTLKLNNISPELSKMTSSVIPVPGLHLQDPYSPKEMITIHSFDSNVAILNTKTKPRKFVIVGSNGRRYTYLLKGKEDLHLDERVMQFLDIVNQLLKRDKQTSVRGLRARNYAVIPLSRMSGLIQWIDGAVPLYQIHLQWRKRSLAAANLIPTQTEQKSTDKVQQTSTSTTTTAKPTVEKEKETPNKLVRLIDLYYAKLIPALKSKGITNVMSRKDWPPDVLKRVFLELEKETPRDLLEKELWCSSATTAEWWKKVQVYSRSAAVMSIVGYIIGLGDRHLDNILIDFESGEVVHIDYNVCFEKGLKLRVPEVVPFRMTQNMQKALGLTGVEGTFRIACEHVLRVLRKSRETLLTLLEAFVYDPLVDWTADRAFIEEKVLDLNVCLSLFCSRIDDVKTSLTENQEALVAKLPSFISSITTLESLRTQQQKLLDELTNKQEKLVQAKDALSKTVSALSKITSFDGRVIKEKQLQEEKESIEKLLHSGLKDCAAWRQSHEKTLTIIKNFDFVSFSNEVKICERIPRTLASVATTLSYLPLRDDIVKKCCDLDSEMTRLLTHREAVLEQCLEFLSTYRSVILQMPPNYAQMSVVTDWEILLTKLLQSQDPQQPFQEILDYVSEEKRLAVAETDREIERALQLEITTKTKKLQEIKTSVGLMETTCGQLEIHIKQLREQLTAAVVTANTQHKEKEGSRYAQNAALLYLADLYDQFNQKMQTETQWIWNDFANIFDQVMFILILIRDLWAESDAVNAAEIERDLLYSFQESLVPGVTKFLTNFSSIVLPEIVKAVHTRDTNVMKCFNDLIRLSTEAKKMKEQQSSTKSQKSSQSNEPGASSSKNVDDLWDMPTPSSKTEIGKSDQKTTTSFFEFGIPDTKLEYENLIRIDTSMHPSSETSMSELNGKILLAAFDKLFQDLEQQHNELVELCKSEMSDFEEHNKENIFFTQKLETMSTVISICMEGTVATLSSEETLRKMNAAISRFMSCYFVELIAPIFRTLMFRFIETRYHGKQPLNKDTPLKPQIDGWIKALSQQDIPSDLILRLLSELISTRERLKVTLQEKSILISQIAPLEVELAKKQIDCAHFQWLREESLKYFTTVPENFVPPSYARSKLLENIAATMKSLFSFEQALKDINKTYCEIEDEVYKVLQWYCAQKPTKIGRGAGSQQQQQQSQKQIVLKNFSESMTYRRQCCKILTEKTKEITDLCKSILELETFKILPNTKNKTTKETAAGAIHQTYFQIAQRYYDNVTALNTLRKEIEEHKTRFEQLTKEHQELVKLNSDLNNEINNISKELSEIQEKYAAASKEVNTRLSEMETLYNSETQLINEIDSLLTNIIKVTEKWESVSQIHSLASKLQKHQTSFLGEFEIMMRLARQVSEAATKSSVDPHTQFDLSRFEEHGPSLLNLKSKIQKQIMELHKMAIEWQQQQQQEDKQSDIQSSQDEAPPPKQSLQQPTDIPEEKLEVAQQEGVDVEPVEGHSDEDDTDTKLKTTLPRPPASRTTKMVSTKNVYAMNVLRRVKAKLEGRDFASQKVQDIQEQKTDDTNVVPQTKRMSVAEQVDWVIREATSVDNLSKMYEGWTAWI